MAGKEILTLTTQHPSILLLDAPTIARTPTKPKKAVLECPRCCWIFEAQPPDSQHPNCTFSKPKTSEAAEEPRVCRNPKCKKQFTLYWHNQPLQTQTKSSASTC